MKWGGTAVELKEAKRLWAQAFCDNAEAWWVKQGYIVPPAETPEYRVMYNAWIDHMRND